jgi:cell division septal protein FtsQ
MTNKIEEQEHRQAWKRARREKLIVFLLFFLGAALALWLLVIWS